MQVTVPATLDKVTSLKDGSLRITFETQELDAVNCTTLMQMRLQLGWLVFAPNDETPIAPVHAAPEDDKSPAQRLRQVLFRLHEYEQRKEPFEIYYRSRMDGIINKIKFMMNTDNYVPEQHNKN